VTLSRLPDLVNGTPWQLTARERKTVTCSDSPDDAMACQRTLYLGFFFDGTRNNLYYDKPSKTHSNVARLYEAFDREIRPGEERQYRQAIYVPGVGTEFWKGVGDAGVGLHANAGAAAGWGGEARINWALLQLQNSLHLYACDNQPLTNEAEDRAEVQRMSTDISLERMQQAFPEGTEPPTPKSVEDRKLRGEVKTKETFQAIASTQWRDTNINGRREVLAERRAKLLDALQPVLTGKLPRLARIRISVFGFSRGAAEARVFVNWLRDLCDEAQGPMRICGVPTLVDFLGIFDTVASVGAAQGFMEGVATGHGGWAQRRDLRIPGQQVVARCLHLVAGHEVRGSFPLDAAAGPNVEEVVYPGVHSDVGGGYLPGEQGRGLTDDAKLSQLPLCHMYRAALAAGVPLVDVAQAPQALQDAFKVSPGLISRFNAYLLQLRENTSGDGANTEEWIRQHYRPFLQWRRYYVDKYQQLLARVPKYQDGVDLAQANLELVNEWRFLLELDAMNRVRNSTWLNGYIGALVKLRIVQQSMAWAAAAGVVGGPVARVTFDDLPGGWVAGMSPSLDGAMHAGTLVQAAVEALKSKHKQWRQTENAWNAIGLPHAAICTLLEQDVHDSRAWFKPLGDDDDVWMDEALQRIQRLEQKEKRERLMEQERKDLDRYRRQMAGRPVTDTQALERALPPQESGRELYQLWGYLRWRTVYQDLVMDYRQQYPQLAASDRKALLQRKRALERESEQLEAAYQKRYRSFSKSSMSMGSLMGGGGGMSMPPDLNEMQGLLVRKQEVEAELKAVFTFLDELGPTTWWESAVEKVMPW